MVVAEGNTGAAFGCDGKVIYLMSDGGTYSTETFAQSVDREASERGCLPQAVPPVECLGLSDDPVACGEDN